VLVTVDRTNTTGGDIHALLVFTTAAGSADVVGLELGVGVIPIRHNSGTFGDMDSCTFPGLTDILSSCTSTGSDVTLFDTADSELVIGDAAKFSSIDVSLATESNKNIEAKFEFSTGSDTWTVFSPSDGTNGFQDTSVIAWELSDIPTWATGTSTRYFIRITRTRTGNIATPPVEDKLQISAITEYMWGDTGILTVSSLNASSTSSFDGDLTIDGSGNAQIKFPNLAGDATNPAICFEDAGGVCDTGIFQNQTNQFAVTLAGQQDFLFHTSRFVAQQGNAFAWDTVTGAGDLFLEIDAANILAQRNGTNAQTFRVYETFTDASNNQGLFIDAGVTTADAVTIGAFTNGTGTDNIDLILSPAGTGKIGINDTAPNQLLGLLGTNAQISIEESDTEFLRLGVEATGGDMVIGWDDSDDLHLGVFDSPTDTSVNPFMIIRSTGNVGIGNTVPGVLLEVSASATNSIIEISTWSTTAGDQSVLKFQKSASATINTLSATASGEDLGEIRALGVDTSSATQQAARILFEGDASPDADAVPGRILFFTSDTSALVEAFRVSDDQRLLSGTAAGWGLLNETSSATNPTLIPDRTELTTGIGGTSNELSLIVLGLEALKIDTSGNVGIGTTSPYTTLSVVGEIVGSHFTATTTSTSTLPQLDVNGIQATDFIQISGDVIIDFAGTGLTVIATTGILEVDASQTQITAVGALDGGTITANFGNIDIGSSNFDADGTVNLGGVVTISATGTLVIPQSATCDSNANGELCHDTTDDQLILDSRVIQTEVRIWGVTVASTTPAFDSGGLLPAPTQLDGYTMTRVQCHVDTGTSKIIAVEDASANSSEDITCATTNTTDDGSITNATVTASELMFIDFGATSGTVDNVSISVFGTWTRE